MSKKAKRGKKPLGYGDALAYVTRRLQRGLAKASKAATPSITKSARRTVSITAAHVPTPADDVVAYRDLCRAEQVLGALNSGDPGERAWGTSVAQSEAQIIRTSMSSTRPRHDAVMGDPSDPAQRETILKIANGWDR